MLKKLLAIVAASVMMLSCFGGAASAATSGTIVDEFTDSTKYKSTEYGAQFNNTSWSLDDGYGLTAENTKQLLTVTYEVDGVIESISTEAIYTSVVASQTIETYAEDLVFYLSKDGRIWDEISVETTQESKSTTYSGRKMQKRTFVSQEINDTYSFLKVAFPASAAEGDIDGDGTVGWNNRWYIVIDSIAINYTIPDYTWGELVAKEEASSDTSSNAAKWDLDTDDSRKRTYMNYVDPDTEAVSGMWRLYNNGEESGTYIRLSSSNSYGLPIIDGYNDVFRITSHNSHNNENDVSGYTFYSVTDKLIPRMMFVDAAHGNNTNPTSKKEAMTLTYEFDFKTLYNFINTEFTIGTGFASSDTNKAICALYVDDKGFVYATSSNFTGSNGEKIAELELDTTYRIGIVIDLAPTETANTYNYEISVYIDGVKKFNGLGSDEVTSVKPGYYGMELEPKPWTVSEFDYANSELKDLDSVYTSQDTSFTNNSGDTKLSSSVKYEYTIIDTDTIISSYNVYAYDKYAQDVPSFADATKKFHITSNVRKGTNYVTVGADAGTAAAGKAILATYNGDKLVNVKTQDLTLSADAITQTDIELTNDGATKKTLFIFDSLGNLKPLAAATPID